ncbi:MAG: hypothetical protein OHK0012_08520 [Synechococcales cyanobacterium]
MKSVDLWPLTLRPTPSQHQSWFDLLSEEEQCRYHRLVKPVDRERFLSARGQLRLILSHYVPQPPGRLLLATLTHGKPYLPDWPDLQFNLSHSQDQALCAVTWGSPLGVDLEVHRPCPTLKLAQRCFHPNETLWFCQQPRAAQTQAFFQLWTVREAWSKALGVGLGGWSDWEVDPLTWRIGGTLGAKPHHIQCLNGDNSRSAALAVVDTSAVTTVWCTLSSEELRN